MEIIDFHIHPVLDDTNNLCFYKEIYDLSPENQIKQLRDAGITHVCGSVIEMSKDNPNMEVIKRCNRKAVEMKKIWGKFYTPGIHVHPYFVEESINEIEFAHENGINLIGELEPYGHRWKDPSDERFDEILNYAAKYDMVVSIHSADGDDNTAWEHMIKTHKNITFVAAHPGDRKRMETHVERMKKFENYNLDLSGTGIFRFGIISHMINEVGSDRLLFGTDYPITNPLMYVQAIKGEYLKDSDYENIMYNNARRILGKSIS